MSVTLTASLLLSFMMHISLTVSQSSSSRIPQRVIDQFFKDLCPSGCSKEEVGLWKRNLRHKARDLNGDGVPEWFLYVVHSDWCGAGGNCSYSVYQKTPKGFTLLLNDKVLVVGDTVTNGYRDLASEFPMGVCADGRRELRVTLYRHDGRKYRAHGTETECRASRQ
jgi:hypothetical protein